MACSSPMANKEREEKERESPVPTKPPPSTPLSPKKHITASSLMRAVLFISGRSSKGRKASSLQAEVVHSGGKGLWRSLVCVMHPLHMQRLKHRSPTQALMPPPSPERPFHDVLLPPPSLVSSVDGMSQYTSAEDLQALDNGSDAEDIEIVHDDGSPHLIDVQAEQFICRFYEQIRLQRLESVARGNGLMVEHGA